MRNFQTRYFFGYIIIVYNTHFKNIGYIHTIWHTVKVDGVYLKTTFLQLLRFKLTRQYLDENLSWLNHINHISKNISKSMFIMRQVKHILDRKSMKTLYYSLIHPHITYCLLAWGNANKNSLKKITILQKRAIRLIDQAHYNSHSEPIFKKLNILKISDQYELDVVLFMNKFQNKKTSNFLP